MLIDIHHHLLYGVDDGAQTLEETRQMLLRAQAQGVTHIVATPHAYPGEACFPTERCQTHLAHTQEMCEREGIPIKVCLGAEILYAEAATDALCEGRIPTLAGTRYVLVEFIPEAPFEQLCEAARRLGSRGFQPIFAHIERYRCLRKIRNLEYLHDEYGVLMQINAHTVLGKRGFLLDRWYRRAMEIGLIDIAASDAHGLEWRSCRLGECKMELERCFGEEVAKRLCITTPGRILELLHLRE